MITRTARGIRTADLHRATTKWLIAVVTFVAFVTLAACASTANLVDHSFGFDTRKDDQDAIVLDYRYGDSELPVRSPEWAVREGRTFAFQGVQGPMRKGDFLYVKWRDKATGKVFEDTVDLRHRLPADITDHTIYFMCKGAQLYVYLISPAAVERSPDSPPEGPRMYRSRNTVMIYPDRPKH